MLGVRELIANDKLEEAIRLLREQADGAGSEFSNDAATYSAEWAGLRKSYRRGDITNQEWSRAHKRLCFAILDLLELIEKAAAEQPNSPSTDAGLPSEPSSSEPSSKVFLSYNHEDREVVVRVKQNLEGAGITVQIDTANMAPGEDIRGFIKASHRATDVTVCIISNNSLLSGWVAAETMLALADDEISGGKRFIACYLDDEFFNTSYLLQATGVIDTKIAELDALIPGYIEKRLDTVDINHEKSRLYELRNSLGKILERLRLSLCLDIRDGGFDHSMKSLVAELNNHG